MSGHDFSTALPLVLGVIFVFGVIRRQLARMRAPAGAEYAAVRAPTAAQPPPPVVPPRRRLAPAPLPRPAVPRTLPARPRITPPAVMAPQALSLEAAAAFPTLDMSLGEGSIPGVPAVAPRRRRAVGGSTVLGSPGWGAHALVALEILGPPVSLRSGATLGAPHAF